MQQQSARDPLAAAVIPAAAVEAPVAPIAPSRAPAPALRAVDGFAEMLVIAALLGELILVLANVFARAYLHHSFLWADELARLTLSTLAFIGGAVAYRRRDHAFVRVVLNACSTPIRNVCFALADVLVLFVAALTG